MSIVLLILLIILGFYGAKKLPELARGMGQAVREFQKARNESSKELKKAGRSEAEKKNEENEETSDEG